MWKRAIKSTIALVLGQILVIVGNILLVPVFLLYWSPVRYGNWLALFSTVSYLSTLHLGMISATINRLTQAHGRGDLEDYVQTQHSATVVYLSVATGGSVLAALVLWQVPLSAWLGLSAIADREAATVAWLLALQVLWAIPATLVSSVPHTCGNLAASQWIHNAQRLLTLLLTAWVVIGGGGPIPVAVGQLFALLSTTALAWWILSRRLPSLMPGISRLRIALVKHLLGVGSGFLVITLAVAMTQQGPIVLVSSTMGGAAVVLFATSRTLANLLHQVVGVLSSVLRPDLTRLEAIRNYASLQQIHRLLVVASSALCAGLGAVLWFEGAEVVVVWTRGRLSPDAILLRLLLVQLVLQAPWLASSTLTFSANRHRILARCYLTSATLGLLLITALIQPLGVYAVPIGLMLGETVACYHFVPKDTCRMIGEPYGPFARRLWSSLAAAGAAALGTAWIAHHGLTGPPLVRWCASGIVTLAVALTVAWFLLLTAEDRSFLASRFWPIRRLA